MYFHHRAWSPRGTLLFRDAAEADLLWEIVTDAFPELDTLCLMPDHLHLFLAHLDAAGRLARAESSFTRARNARRREKGRAWAPHPAAEEVPPDRCARVRRYILLNPARKGLVDDPLRWRWSTHRDRVGLTATRVGPLDRDPSRFHAHISGDPSVAVGGTPLPVLRSDRIEWEALVDAVIEVCRCDAAALRRRGRPRELLLQAAWIHGYQDVARLRADVRIGRTQAYELVRGLPPRGAPIPKADLAAVVRVAGDPRFRPLGPFEALSGWSAYKGRR